MWMLGLSKLSQDTRKSHNLVFLQVLNECLFSSSDYLPRRLQKSVAWATILWFLQRSSLEVSETWQSNLRNPPDKNTLPTHLAPSPTQILPYITINFHTETRKFTGFSEFLRGWSPSQNHSTGRGPRLPARPRRHFKGNSARSWRSRTWNVRHLVITLWLFNIAMENHNS